MRDHTDLLNLLVKKYNLKTYCEIGVQFKHKNFNKIEIEENNKVGVDPDPNAQATYQLTSDDYFKDNNQKFDLFFIDGLHHADQVQRDFENALERLNVGGFIMLHDCHPKHPIHAQVPRNGLRGVWTGDVYKFICCLNNYEGIDFRTVDFDNGCCIVWKTNIKRQENHPIRRIEEIGWEFFQKNKHLMRFLLPVEGTILNQIDISYGK